jgi:antitoxin ParD1/3/4
MAQQSAISLDKQQQELIDRLVRSGRYGGANDVVATGLRLLEEREAQAATLVAEVEAEIATGLASGAAAPMEAADALLADFRRRR